MVGVCEMLMYCCLIDVCSVLSTASLVEHVDCVLPVENQALFDIVR